MRTIHVTKYRPYDYIRLSNEVIQESLAADNLIPIRMPLTHKTDGVHLRPLRQAVKPVAIFGELEWMMGMI